GQRPFDIPRKPNEVYAHQGWAGMGDWLGTGTIATHLREYLPFEKARILAHSLNLKSQFASDNTSPRSRRSGGLRPPCAGPARPEHLSAATWRRSLQACIASLPLQSSLMSKTYLKSDHFNGGGSSAIKKLEARSCAPGDRWCLHQFPPESNVRF